MGNDAGAYDVLIVGGGINGAGIAADAAGRGLRVMMCEMGDLASATSSNSSKLIHGGLRYLEHYEFRLVRESLAEREVLLKKAPHIIHPLRFFLPHQPHLRPAWMIRAGLFLYDHLSTRRALAGSRAVKPGSHSPLLETIKRGFEYSDAWVDDARLVVLNAMAAREQGALIKTRCRCVAAERTGALWRVTLENQLNGRRESVGAHALINATGPWVSDFYSTALSVSSPHRVRLVKGSHIVVPRIHNESRAYILQNADNRVVFVIPYQEQFSLIGTTDVEISGDPGAASISRDEIDYLVTAVNSYFKHKVSAEDVVWTYAGVRPLFDDDGGSPQTLSRDYTLEFQQAPGGAPLISVFGGKITTYRKLAEAVVDKLLPCFPQAGPSRTEQQVLPGGDFADRQQLTNALHRQYPWLEMALVQRFVSCYGTCTRQLLGSASSVQDLGRHFGAGLYQREVEYLLEKEWALTAEDILWRRTKLGLQLDNPACQALAEYLDTAADRMVGTGSH